MLIGEVDDGMMWGEEKSRGERSGEGRGRGRLDIDIELADGMG